jgi:hypothetical protein
MLLYSVGRFVINLTRQDPPVALGLAQAQLVALGSAALAVWFLVYLMVRAARTPEPSATETPLPPADAPSATEPSSASLGATSDAQPLPATPPSSGDRSS